MPAKHVEVDPKTLAAFQKMVSAVPGVTVKGDAYPYASINGNMYAAISKAGRIGLRLPADEREAFIKKFKTGLHEPFPGFFMKEYAAVPDKMLSDLKTLQHYFKMSHEFAAALKAKPTTRSKQAKSKKKTGKKVAGKKVTKKKTASKSAKTPTKKTKARSKQAGKKKSSRK